MPRERSIFSRLRRRESAKPAPAPAPSPVPSRRASTAVITSEVQAIKKQVDQARLLLTDAILKLGDSFVKMETDTSSQKATMESLMVKLSGGASSADGVDASAGERRNVSIHQFAVETTAVLAQFTELLATVSGQSIKTVYRIDDMADELDEVFKLVASINEIAEETFTLAVNATIEAAHAGQAGRSFSVIAGNVRELSKKTRRFNDQIGTQIGKAKATVDEVRLIIADMASRDLNVALAGKERVQSMLPELERFEQFVASSVDRANEATIRIAQATSSAVTALQFEDILRQLISAIERRADRIEAVATSAGTDSDLPRSGDRRASTVPIPDLRPEPESADPVRQQNMTPGEVEMF